MLFYCNSVWPHYTLGSREWWPLNGSLHYYTILHLELFCERASENDEIPYAEALTLLYQEEKKSGSCCLMVQRFWKENQGDICFTRERGRKWDWGHIISKLKLPSGQLGSSTVWIDCTDCCSNQPHVANIFVPVNTSCFSYLQGSDRSFYVNPWSTGAWYCV